jgi:hypothetical protein
MKDLALKLYVGSVVMAVSTTTKAQEEDLASRILGEGGWIDTLSAVGALILAAAFLAGVGSVSYGIWYYMKKSDNPQEPDAGAKSMKFMLGGAALTIIPLFIGILSLTVGGDTGASGTAADQLGTFQQ